MTRPRSRPARPPARPPLARCPSEQLAAVIAARGLTGYQVAQLADVDHRTVGRFLSGERDIKLRTLDRIAEALGLDLVERSRGRGRPLTPEGQRRVAEAARAVERLDELESDADGVPGLAAGGGTPPAVDPAGSGQGNTPVRPDLID